MTAASLEISDQLDQRVRLALNNALAPYNAKHFVGISVESALCKIAQWEREQHQGAVRHNVVPLVTKTYQPFRLVPKRKRRV